MDSEHRLDQWDQIVAKAWQDDGFKKRLLANPATVLKEQGLEVSPDIQIRVVENTDELIHLTLPAKRREGELSDGELENVAGGALGGILTGVANELVPVLRAPSYPFVKGGKYECKLDDGRP